MIKTVQGQTRSYCCITDYRDTEQLRTLDVRFMVGNEKKMKEEEYKLKY